MRILILEDDPLLALDLQDIAEDCGHEVVGLCRTVASMRRLVDGALDFALLDIDLPDGKSFPIATRLEERRIPYAFVSGSVRGELPEHLRHARFVAKPFASASIRSTLEAGPAIAA